MLLACYTLPVLPCSGPGRGEDGKGKAELRLSQSYLTGAHSELQDPEVQKHATQILRNMLRQEEAELQVRWHFPKARVRWAGVSSNVVLAAAQLWGPSLLVTPSPACCT